MSEPSRYIVGIDLGTTNSALAYIDTQAENSEDAPQIEQFLVPQLVKAGEVDEEALLPSYVFLPSEGEIPAGDLALPWSKNPGYAVGRFARDHGSKVPTRLIASAKSWLCHAGVDRRGPVLPWGAEEDFPKISPLDATVRLLQHLRDAWNVQLKRGDKQSRLEEQDVVLTVPASFDAVARELTAEAAHEAGLQNVTLFEEPQAAFYAWLHDQQEAWRKHVRPGDVILVVDVGGGTTDLTLIAVAEDAGDLVLNRIAVGDHLLLGGDNMDLALAHAAANNLKAKGKLDQTQMLGLWHACRSAKEKLFADPKGKAQTVSVLGRGRKVVGGALKTELDQQTVDNVLLDGFFPAVGVDAEPLHQAGIGLQELGLAYESDPAVTKHIACFVSRHAAQIGECRDGGAKLPSVVLFNGGVFQAEPLRQRVMDVLRDWSGDGDQVREISSAGLDLSVARGAAGYGFVRRGKGIRIRGGVARSYYVGLESAMPAVPGMPSPIKALCVVPKGMEEGTEATLGEREFGLIVGQPVSFRFLSSTQRRDDEIGAIVDDWEDDIEELAPLQTTLDTEDADQTRVPVQLHTKVTEIGTLEVWFESRTGDRRWKLEFNVRETEE